MEDALVQFFRLHNRQVMTVLILVLMEDALVRLVFILRQFRLCLNPCFNGRCTRTSFNQHNTYMYESLNPCFNGRCTRTGERRRISGIFPDVLILVLMEDALVQKKSGRRSKSRKVLILVLMEDALVQLRKTKIRKDGTKS